METKNTSKTTTDTGKETFALNSLIKINNDRYEGYKTAAEETKDAELKSLFTKFSTQSKGFADELRKHVPDPDKVVDHGETTLPGKAFRAWMDLKSAVTGKDRHAILASCEFGEDAALKTYHEVLEHPGKISPQAMELIRKHHAEIHKGHDTVKSLRDSSKK